MELIYQNVDPGQSSMKPHDGRREIYKKRVRIPIVPEYVQAHLGYGPHPIYIYEKKEE